MLASEWLIENKWENQTEEMCLKAVKQDGWTLQYVHTQTPEICLAAVSEKGEALRYVKNQTEAICIAAIMEECGALTYVEKYYKSIADIVKNKDYKNLNKESENAR